PLRLAGLTVTEQSHEPTATDVDLTLTITDGPEGPAGLWQYKTELFDAGTIEALQADFQGIVEQVVENPDVPLDELLGPAPGPVGSNVTSLSQVGVQRAVA